MGPKIGKPTELMDWIAAGLKRGPYMLRIALPFPGHVPSACSLVAGRAPFPLVLLGSLARRPATAGTVHGLGSPQRASKSSLSRDSAATLAFKGPSPGPPGRLPGPYAPHAAPKRSEPQLTAVLSGFAASKTCQLPLPAANFFCCHSQGPPRSRSQTEMT